MNWGFDPLGAKKTQGNIINNSGLGGPLNSIQKNPFGNFLLNGPAAVLPDAYKPNSPWTSVKMVDQEDEENRQKAMAQAYAAMAKGEDQPTA